MFITAEMLRKKNACSRQVKRFEAEWPDGARVTRQTCLRAKALCLDVGWIALHFVPQKALCRRFLAQESAAHKRWNQRWSRIGQGRKRITAKQCRAQCYANDAAYSRAVVLAAWRAVIDSERKGKKK